MAEAPFEPHGWHPEPGFPDDAEFYRRIIDHLPTPVAVVDLAGLLKYANRAMLALSGVDTAFCIGASLLDYVHPEDRGWIAKAFLEVSQSPGARILGTGGAWAEIFLRIVASDGTVIPVEVVGTGAVLDPVIGGVIYEVAPVLSRDLLGRILEGLSSGASMHYLLATVLEMVAGPPLDLDAAAVECLATGELKVRASTCPMLARALEGGRFSAFPVANSSPSFVDTTSLPEPTRAELAAARYQDMWQIGVESPLTSTKLRIFAVSPTHHVPATGPLSRMTQARELAAVVLLRAQTHFGADYDPLTSFPNRAGFARLAEDLDPRYPRAAVHLDLDGMKRVNAIHGQAGGDAVLQIVSDRIRSITRPDDVIGRVGGEEFVVAFASEHAEDDVAARGRAMAEHLLTLSRDVVVVAGRAVNLSASIGVADALPGDSTDNLLMHADVAMREARRAGGGLARYQSPSPS